MKKLTPFTCICFCIHEHVKKLFHVECKSHLKGSLALPARSCDTPSLTGSSYQQNAAFNPKHNTTPHTLSYIMQASKQAISCRSTASQAAPAALLRSPTPLVNQTAAAAAQPV
jgi:hypothetical protein